MYVVNLWLYYSSNFPMRFDSYSILNGTKNNYGRY